MVDCRVGPRPLRSHPAWSSNRPLKDSDGRSASLLPLPPPVLRPRRPFALYALLLDLLFACLQSFGQLLGSRERPRLPFRFRFGDFLEWGDILVAAASKGLASRSPERWRCRLGALTGFARTGGFRRGRWEASVDPRVIDVSQAVRVLSDQLGAG